MTWFRKNFQKLVIRLAVLSSVLIMGACSSVSRFYISSNMWGEWDRKNDVLKVCWQFNTTHIITPKDTLLIDSCSYER